MSKMSKCEMEKFSKFYFDIYYNKFKTIPKKISGFNSYKHKLSSNES